MRALVVTLVLCLSAPAPRSDTPRALAPVVNGLVETVIAPAYGAFAETAADQEASVRALCAAPSAGALAAARDGFRNLVVAFSAVELYRFGPAREDNRIERLYFWPDRRGRGLKQVQALLAEQDETATDPDTLYSKSVAVQGLPALEFALFGTDSEALASGADHRCRYASAITEAVTRVADALEKAWRGSFAATLRNAGADNPTYRSHGEALQDILQGAAEQFALVAAFKLDAPVGETPSAAHPRRASFWRSDATLAAIVSNLRATQSLLSDDLGALLGDDEVLVRSARFELDQAIDTLVPLAQDARGWAAVSQDVEAHKRLRYTLLPIGGAHTLFAERIPAALGLIAGFNALDGD